MSTKIWKEIRKKGASSPKRQLLVYLPDDILERKNYLDKGFVVYSDGKPNCFIYIRKNCSLLAPKLLFVTGTTFPLNFRNDEIDKKHCHFNKIFWKVAKFSYVLYSCLQQEKLIQIHSRYRYKIIVWLSGGKDLGSCQKDKVKLKT